MTEQSREQAAVHQDKYDQMMRLADLFDSSGDEMRERAKLGAEVLADEAVSESADLSPTTYTRAEDEILAATTGRNGLMARSVELDFFGSARHAMHQQYFGLPLASNNRSKSSQ